VFIESDKSSSRHIVASAVISGFAN